MTVTVVNKFKEPNHIYCGRGSPLGNPHIFKEPYPLKEFKLRNAKMILANKLERDRVCLAYIDWFNKKLVEPRPTAFHNQLHYLVEIAKLQDINLGCFCAPKRCHCDTIKAYIEEKLNVPKNT